MIYIILPVHNRCDITRRFVRCLAEQTYNNYHLLLVDDGSTDGTAEMARELVPATTVLRGDGTWWWGGALQEGYEWLQAHAGADDVVVIANDDTEFAADFLETGLALLQNMPRTLLLASCFDRESGVFVDAGVVVDWSRLRFSVCNPGDPVNCLSTRGLFMVVRDFWETGGFRPKLLPHYLSDYEFTIRARRKGFSLVSSEKLRLVLDSSRTGDHGRISLKTLFSNRSARNPVAWTAFLFLACPVAHIPLNLVRVWGGALVGIAMNFKSFKQ